MNIKIHKSEDFQKMREAGKLAAKVLDYITDFVKPGVTTDYLNELCHQFTIGHGAIPAPLHYQPAPYLPPFPKSICTSINEVVCHGIPSEYELKNGDILNIDVTVILNGWHGDTSRMFYIGDVSEKRKQLIKVTYEAMMLGIETVKPGSTINDIAKAITNHAKKYNYSVVRAFCGHGIGKEFHQDPNIFHHFDTKSMFKNLKSRMRDDVILKEGMFFTVEPMINEGTYLVDVDPNDKWTARTKDRKDSAQFEHTIAVTSNGYEIFTQSPNNLHYPPYDK